MKLTDFISEERIFLDLAAKGKQELITAMAKRLEELGAVRRGGDFASEVWKREAGGSTAIGCGVAIPHARTSAVDEIVVSLAKLRRGLDFHAPDHVPVRLVFLIGVPATMANEYLKVLARISKLAGSDEARERILSAESPAQVMAALGAGHPHAEKSTH